MQYLVTQTDSNGWPNGKAQEWVEAGDTWPDFIDTVKDKLTVYPQDHPTRVDYVRSATGIDGLSYAIYQPHPRMHEIHTRNLCCGKAVILPCMCAVAYMCPEHRPDRKQCVGSHD